MLNSYLKNIEDENSFLECIYLSKFDELEKIFNSSNLSNVEKFYIHHIFKNQNFKKRKFWEFSKFKISNLQKIGIDNVKLNFKEKIKNQILLLNKQRKILLKELLIVPIQEKASLTLSGTFVWLPSDIINPFMKYFNYIMYVKVKISNLTLPNLSFNSLFASTDTIYLSFLNI